jgi:hypothetical protein
MILNLCCSVFQRLVLFDVHNNNNSLSRFSPFRCSVFRGSVIFDVQSFDVRSHSRLGLSTFSLSTFGPIRRSVFRFSVPFEVWSFDVWSFSMFGHSTFGHSTFSLSRFGLSRFGHSKFGHGFPFAYVNITIQYESFIAMSTLGEASYCIKSKTQFKPIY